MNCVPINDHVIGSSGIGRCLSHHSHRCDGTYQESSKHSFARNCPAIHFSANHAASYFSHLDTNSRIRSYQTISKIPNPKAGLNRFGQSLCASLSSFRKSRSKAALVATISPESNIVSRPPKSVTIPPASLTKRIPAAMSQRDKPRSQNPS